MMTFEQFYSQVAPKFDGWLWADYEAKFLGDDLYIKASTDFCYYHLFDLYIRQAKISAFLPEWTTKLPKEKLFEVRDDSLVFKTGKLDHYIDLVVEGTEFLGSVFTSYYIDWPPTPQPYPGILSGYYFNLEEVNHVHEIERFQRLIME